MEHLKCTIVICEIPDDASKGHDDSVEGKLISRGRFAAMEKGSCWQDLQPSVGKRRELSSFRIIIWRSTDFFRHVVGEKEGRRAITFAFVCERCNLFPVEDVLWWVYINCEARRNHCGMSGWWCGGCGQPCDWGKSNRLLTFQIGNTANEHVIFPAYGASDGECVNCSQIWQRSRARRSGERLNRKQ